MTGVPFQRPESFGERTSLNDEEFARRQKAVEAQSTGSFVVGAWGEPGKAQRHTSLIVEPSNGRLPALTPEGLRRSAYMKSSWQSIPWDSPADFDTWDRCITRGLLPWMLPAQFSNGIQIHLHRHLSLAGFNTFKRDGIELTGSFVATVNAELKVEERLLRVFVFSWPKGVTSRLARYLS